MATLAQGLTRFLQGRMAGRAPILSSYRGCIGVAAAGIDAANPGLTRARQHATTAAQAKDRARDAEH